MNYYKLERLFWTFHDFDLIEMEPVNGDLHLKFRCYWNQMNDEDNPYMTFKFVFTDCEIIEFEYYPYEGPKDNNEDEFGKIVTKDCKEIVEEDISFNRFKEVEDQHWFYCGGDNEKNHIAGAIVKLKFNSDQFIIYDSDDQKLPFENYLEICEAWWKFVFDR